MDLNFEIHQLRTDLNKVLDLLEQKQVGKSEIRMYDMVDLETLLHVSKRTIASWKKRGILPYSQVGNKTWITEDQLKSFLEQNNPIVNKNDFRIRKGGKQ